MQSLGAFSSARKRLHPLPNRLSSMRTYQKTFPGVAPVPKLYTTGCGTPEDISTTAPDVPDTPLYSAFPGPHIASRTFKSILPPTSSPPVTFQNAFHLSPYQVYKRRNSKKYPLQYRLTTHYLSPENTDDSSESTKKSPWKTLSSSRFGIQLGRCRWRKRKLRRRRQRPREQR